MSQWIKCKTVAYISQKQCYIPGVEIVLNTNLINNIAVKPHSGIANDCGCQIYEVSTTVDNFSNSLALIGPQLDQIFENATFEIPSRPLPLHR